MAAKTSGERSTITSMPAMVASPSSCVCVAATHDETPTQTTAPGRNGLVNGAAVTMLWLVSTFAETSKPSTLAHHEYLATIPL